MYLRQYQNDVLFTFKIRHISLVLHHITTNTNMFQSFWLKNVFTLKVSHQAVICRTQIQLPPKYLLIQKPIAFRLSMVWRMMKGYLSRQQFDVQWLGVGLMGFIDLPTNFQISNIQIPENIFSQMLKAWIGIVMILSMLR